VSRARRPRAERREAERRADKLVRDRKKLMALEPGGTSEHPIAVISSSQIEPHARSLHCARCGPELVIVDQIARVVDARVRRKVELRCKRCGDVRIAHFVIIERLLQ
jgi:RNase P subunit RPR2